MILSKASPVKNLQSENDQKELAEAVATEPMKPQAEQINKAGMRPLLSAIQPNKKPPTIEPA